jgi:hypothetical protein
MTTAACSPCSRCSVTDGNPPRGLRGAAAHRTGADLPQPPAWREAARISLDLDALETSLDLVAPHGAHGVVALVRDLGARPEHYRAVGAALISAMARVAGDAWQPRYDRAWVAAVDAVTP